MRFKEGDAVVYEKTGTRGHITKIVEMDGKIWAELDSTGLLYDENVLELTEEAAVAEEPRKIFKEERARAKEEGAEVSEEQLKGGDMTIDTSGSCSGAG
ncbi:MAG: DUF2098 family protein [Candidatus Methanosuratincola sp.]|uniref:DUF2098 domain-containing protein n=1 Tax=Methanosuratincola subterraneus TaxID=2593994 RepID=A0A3S3S0M6_METS7|nr:MAG: hypothetical protein Metus_0625 [Candidatus Methanosuratincola subterraneus]